MITKADNLFPHQREMIQELRKKGKFIMIPTQQEGKTFNSTSREDWVMFQADWTNTYDNLKQMIHDLDIDEARLADVTPAQFRSGLWVESATYTLFVIEQGVKEAPHQKGPLIVYCWNSGQARVDLIKLLCKYAWKVS